MYTVGKFTMLFENLAFKIKDVIILAMDNAMLVFAECATQTLQDLSDEGIA